MSCSRPLPQEGSCPARPLAYLPLLLTLVEVLARPLSHWEAMMPVQVLLGLHHLACTVSLAFFLVNVYLRPSSLGGYS